MKIVPAISVPEPQALQSNPGSSGPPPGSGGLFKNMLAQVSQGQRQADVQIQQALTGTGELHDAMLALENANLGLKFLIQVRNKLLQAYEELNRMSM